jgi:glycyl-tRNA synthetase beta chain
LLPLAAADSCTDKILAFIADRLKIVLRDAGVGHDVVTAVFSLDLEDDLVRLRQRAQELQRFLETEDGVNLLAAYRRAGRIVTIEEKKDRVRYDQTPDPAFFKAPEERELAERLAEVDRLVDQAIRSDEFSYASESLRALRQTVDAFFDKVTVNVEEEALRANRLRLLAQISAALDRVADFSKIEG